MSATVPYPTPEEDNEGLEELSDEQLKLLQEYLPKLIDHRVQGIEYAEARRSVIPAIAGTLLAAAIALIAIVVDKIPHLPLRAGLIALSALLIVTTLLVWFVYARQ